MSEFEWVKSFAESSYGTTSDAFSLEPKQSRSISPTTSRGSFASFVCHVTNLERKLRSFSPLVLDNSSTVRVTNKVFGQGKTFMVKHAQWVRDAREPPLDVALKEIIPVAQASDGSSSFSTGSSPRMQSDWKDILFELRALLHEPIRYHPNLVRLLGIQWGLSPISDSTYPVLIMEYASLGTFHTLQVCSEPLPFPIKQKLCYDVGRALSALHACGIVHGDIKHENVLIFPSENLSDDILYTAKLADFGGSVMDMTSDDFRKMETWTWPVQAPEIKSDQHLNKHGMMLTDVYSFGLLVWRAFEDGDGFVSLPGAAQDASDEDKRSLSAQKASESFTATAVTSVSDYASIRGVSQRCTDMIVYTILHTVRLKPENRDLVKAQAALRGISPGHISNYLSFIKGKNEEHATREARRAPGSHGITRDSLAFFLGRYGDNVDLQDNMPGFRPRLDEPNLEEFLFEPERLKNILTWDQQHQMLNELKETAGSIVSSFGDLLGMKNTVAAFYVFQCYLLEFGTKFDADEAVHWLLKASADDNSHEDATYFSQAWLWRISRALGVRVDFSTERLKYLMKISVMRGHHTCLQDLLELIASNTEPIQQQWLNSFHQFRHILFSQMGAVGMGYFFSSHMTSPWNTIILNDLTQLDESFRAILGDHYETSLKSSNPRLLGPSTQQSEDRERTAFDRIYINRRGHGPLHYAAAMGSLDALHHMITKYECDVDLPNQHVDETPLVCACSGGKLDCALLLLNHGSDPNGYMYGQEGPLHWLSSFLPTEMKAIASTLITAGADIELCSGGMRADVRGIRADWEHIFEIRTTPLGRAVLMNNLNAVKTLLKLGADPLTKSANKHRGEWEGLENASKMIDISSPFEIAAVLTFSDILIEFIKHIDGPNGTPRLKLINESSMIDLAHNKKVTDFDPLSLQSRLVRHGVKRKSNLQITLSLLYVRSIPFYGTTSDAVQSERSKVLCKEVVLGNFDIVECLLALGYSASGTPNYRPLVKAIELNHEEIFNLLMRYRPDTSVKTMTPTGSISLLHICASRPRQSRPGRAIADALIAAGVPLESADRQVKSPLAMAVLNQSFDVASALLENGANVNAMYPLQMNILNGPEPKLVSVLVEVLSQHTMWTFESLKFLFGKRAGGPTKRPAFYVDHANKFSILHLLAGSPNYTQIAQITPKILNLCLEIYSDREFINYRHPLLGTALYYAATTGHKAMVERLLQHGADETYNAGPDIDGSVHTLFRPRETWTPLWAAVLRFDEELRKGISFPTDAPSGTWLDSNIIQNIEKIMPLLSSNTNDMLAKQAVKQLREKKELLQSESRASRMERLTAKREGKSSEGGAPIDLGILSGKSSERDEMEIREICKGVEEDGKTEELKTFLRYTEYNVKR